MYEPDWGNFEMSNHLHIFSLREALQTGLTRRTISKKVSNGEFLKISHGIYVNTQAKIPFEHIDFILAHYKFGPHSIMGDYLHFFITVSLNKHLNKYG